ncbi:MAG: NAD(P)-binding domain-containing protein [Candidatus Velamenicoccus archaeovorus]
MQPDEALFVSEDEADPSIVVGSTVAVVGYGNLGRSIALNLRDAGAKVVVGNRDDAYRATATGDGLTATDIAEAVSLADVVWLLIPDEVMGEVFAAEVGPALRPSSALCFSSGYALAYGLVAPPEGVDVLMVAPRMLGEQARRTYEEGSGFVSYVSVEQDATGRARERVLGLAAAVGALRRGALWLDARREAILDLLIEQTVGPYLGTAIQLAFQLGVEAGLPPEALVLEMYMSGEMARTFQTFAELGFFRSAAIHGVTAEYGGFLRTLELDRDEMERTFRHVLEEITTPVFARRLQEERDQGSPALKAIEEITSGNDPITAAEERVRRHLR